MLILTQTVMIICVCAIQAYEIREADPTVILTHVLFRHGNRTPEITEVYPKDPYYNYTYFPIGRGQLTNIGKVREYQIGEELRKRYNTFLGDYYYPELVDAVSTNKNRTKASLELVLASLFPPRKNQIWNPALNWQPVPYNYKPVTRDPVLCGIFCPNYQKKYNEVVNSPRWQGEFNKERKTFDYIADNTGLNVTMFQNVYDLYFGLSTEEEFGLKLPEWTKSVWPETITKLAIREYFVQTATTDLLKIVEGFHLKKIIEDTKNKVKNLRKNQGPKIYLYSAHENNVAEMQILLNVFKEPHVPTYGSYLVFEVHNINNVIGIKLYYNHYTKNGLELLKIPSCDEFCPLDKFEELFAEYLPASEDLCYNLDN